MIKLNSYQVLKTIPWEKMDIEVITVETNHAGEVFAGTRYDIKEYLEDNGYVLVHTVGGDIFILQNNGYKIYLFS